jgi:hypothetical protein
MFMLTSPSRHTAGYLLRRVANKPVQMVAMRVRVSLSRIAKIQRKGERRPLTSAQVQGSPSAKSRTDPICSHLFYAVLLRA